MKKAFIIFTLIIVLLLLPLIFNKKSHLAMIGPDLSELDYSEIFFENDLVMMQDNESVRIC